ncbi:MAG: endonuclease/exonuclease/phosphatase family protein [Myxococcota bacterium]
MKHAVALSMLVALGWSCGPPPVVDQDSGTDASIGELDGGSFPADSGAPDASTPGDAGFDAGTADAGRDAGGDAGFDGGVDAGFDGGVDAGFDAGTADAGRIFTDAGWCPAPAGGTPFHLRALAANLTSGNNQSYDPGHGARIMRGVSPDIVMIQEFNYGNRTTADFDTFVSNTFDGGYAWFRGVGNIPNGIISRWPILTTGEWQGQSPDRRLTYARIDLPGPNELWVISVHMPTSSAGSRNTDAQTIIARIDAGIPAGDYILLGGDFNTDNRSESCFTTFSRRFRVAGPHPVDQNGDEGTNANRDKPYDNVISSPCLARQQVPTVIGNSTFPSGLVVDTRVYTPLTEIAPAQFGDSNSSNMQHMGVVKDFLIQP